MENESITKTIEEKIDFLIEESEKAKIERKRERILSKIDGLYNVLIAFLTFTIGIMVSRYDFLYEVSGLLVPLMGIVSTMIFSFSIGFRGMVNDSMENRVLAWCLLIVSLVFYSISYIIAVLFYPSMKQGQVLVLIAPTVLGFFCLCLFNNW